MNLAMDPDYYECFYNRGNQGRFAGKYEHDGFSALNARLDMLTSVLEQKRNASVLNSNHMICDLCGGYHATYKCRQAQNVDYYGEFEHYNSCFDQSNPSCGDFYDYGWNNPCGYSDFSCSYDYQSQFVQNQPKPSWELAIEKLANAPFSWEQTSETLANEEANDRLANEIDANLERLANAIADRFDNFEERLDELTSHFCRIQEQLHDLCEVIFSNDMLIDPNMSGRNVSCENGLHFDDNNASNMSFDEEISISCDNAFEMTFEPQEEHMNGLSLTPLEECFENEESHVKVPLANSQMVPIQGDIYEALGIGKSLPSLKLYEDKVHKIEPVFVDPPRPKMVDYSLTKPP